jgi:hypothetical protein
MAGLGASRVLSISLDRLLAIALAGVVAPTGGFPAPWIAPNHLPLALVVERQPKRIAKGHQRPLHGIGLGLLDGGFMGQAQIGIDAMAGAGSLADQ